MNQIVRLLVKLIPAIKCAVSTRSSFKVLCSTPSHCQVLDITTKHYHSYLWYTLSLLSLVHPVALVTHWKTLPDITGISFSSCHIPDRNMCYSFKYEEEWRFVMLLLAVNSKVYTYLFLNNKIVVSQNKKVKQVKSYFKFFVWIFWKENKCSY
jgi:FPC/CPF motif-containing protein YcgG